jgi:aminoglycoside 6'-N-acetyltransferase I
LLRPARREDRDGWLALRTALWPEADVEALRLEIEDWFWSGNRDTQCIVAEEHGELLGFIELSVRGYAEGCESDRVGYVEGWYVVPNVRQQHVGRDLMRAGESWAAARGCREFASDTEAGNTLGQSAHLACGFLEVERIVCFRKAIGETVKR